MLKWISMQKSEFRGRVVWYNLKFQVGISVAFLIFEDGPVKQS